MSYNDPLYGTYTYQFDAGYYPTKTATVTGLRFLNYSFWMTSFLYSASGSSNTVKVNLHSVPAVNASGLICSALWEVTSAAVTLSWLPSSVVSGNAITSYQFIMLTNTTNMTTTILPSEAPLVVVNSVIYNSYTFGNLTSGAILSWQLVACNSIGCSTPTSATTCNAQTIPPTPNSPTITPLIENPINGTLLLRVNWAASSAFDGNFTSNYVIQFSSDGSTYSNLVNLNTSTRLTYSQLWNFTQTSDVNTDYTYYWKVVAVNPAGISTSALASYLNTYPPVTPTLLSLGYNDADSTITVKWFGSNVATAGFYIQISTTLYGYYNFPYLTPINVTVMGSTLSSFTFSGLTSNSPYKIAIASFSVYAGTTTPKVISDYSPTQIQFTTLSPQYNSADIEPIFYPTTTSTPIGTATFTTNFVPSNKGLPVYYSIYQVTSYYSGNQTETLLVQNATTAYYSTIIDSASQPCIIRWRYQLCSPAGCGIMGDFSDPFYVLSPPSNLTTGPWVDRTDAVFGAQKVMHFTFESVLGALGYSVYYSIDTGTTWIYGGFANAPTTGYSIIMAETDYDKVYNKTGMLRIQAQAESSYSNWTTVSFIFYGTPGGMSPPTLNLTAVPTTANGDVAQWHANWTAALFTDQSTVTYTLLMSQFDSSQSTYVATTAFTGKTGTEADFSITNTPGSTVYFSMYATNQFGNGATSVRAQVIVGYKPVAPIIAVVGYFDYYLSDEYYQYLTFYGVSANIYASLPCATYQMTFEQVSGGPTTIYSTEGNTMISGDTLVASLSTCTPSSNSNATLTAYGVNSVGVGPTGNVTFNFYPPLMCRPSITSISFTTPTPAAGQRYGLSTVHIQWHAFVSSYTLDVHIIQYSTDSVNWLNATTINAVNIYIFDMDLQLPSGYSYSFRVLLANKAGSQVSSSKQLAVFPAPTICGTPTISQNENGALQQASIVFELPQLCSNDPLVNSKVQYQLRFQGPGYV